MSFTLSIYPFLTMLLQYTHITELVIDQCVIPTSSSSGPEPLKGLWPGAQLHILGMSLSECLSNRVRKLKISVNMVARTMKLDIEHPWAHWVK